jgi:fructokinase
MNFPNKNILCIGEVLWDVFGESRKPGGAPLNVALHLNRLNNRVNVVSRVGDDEKGRALTDFVLSKGLNTNYIQVDRILPTSEVLVSLDKKGNASFEIVQPVAWDKLEFNSDLEMLAKKAGVIVYGSLASRNSYSRETIIKSLNKDAIKIVDVNLRPPFTDITIVKDLLSRADIAKLNNDELRIIAEWDNFHSEDEKELVKWMSNQYKLKMVCVTKGDKGALLYDNNIFYYHKGFKVKVADTVGAGDAFLAGLIYSFIQGDSDGDSLTFACATGAFVASRDGATPDYVIGDIKKIITNSI